MFYFVDHSFYRPQRSWAKVMLLQASVILSMGGCLPQCMLGCHTPPKQTHIPLGAETPPPEQTPPRADTHPLEQTPPPPGADTPRADTPLSRHPLEQTPPPPRADIPPEQTHPPRNRLRHMVNERPVRILLECILVS